MTESTTRISQCRALWKERHEGRAGRQGRGKGHRGRNGRRRATHGDGDKSGLTSTGKGNFHISSTTRKSLVMKVILTT